EPFELPIQVSDAISSLTVKATATDNTGHQASASRTVPVTADPLTSVIGMVVDKDGAAVSGATVKVFNTFSAQSDATGAFHFDAVPTILGPVTARATIVVGNATFSGSSAVTPFVRGGITDVGTVVVRNGVRHVLLLGPPFGDVSFTRSYFEPAMP